MPKARQVPRGRSEGFRLTKVGLWFGVFGVIALGAAINTGNNGLYLVVALMGGTAVVSQLLAAANVRGLEPTLEPPAELFAKTLSTWRLRIRSHGRLPRWMLVATVEGEDVDAERRTRSSPYFLPFLAARGETDGDLELVLARRGRHRIRRLRLSSLFPFGFFRKGMRYPLDVEVLVFPEIYASPGLLPALTGRWGEEPTPRAGAGYDLFALRPFRPGDDPRGVHWKQSARTGEMVFKERRAEESRRLSIVLDNGLGELDEGERARFERLVSEAATAAVVYLERGFEVEVVTRDRKTPFGAGRRQRWAVLEHLALVEPVAASASPLQPAAGAPELRLAISREEKAA